MAFATHRVAPSSPTTRTRHLAAWLILISLFATGCRSSATNRNIDGVRNFQVGQYQGALQEFQRALLHNPNDPNAYYNMAATYYALGKRTNDGSLMQQAEGLYHRCLDINPNHTDCYRGLAALLVDTNRPDSAFTLMNRWASRSPNNPEARVELARLYEEFGDRKTASRFLTDALHLDTRNVRAWTALAKLREQEGQLAQALENYRQAYQLNRFQPGVVERIAALQRHLSTSGPNRRGTQLASPENTQSR